MQSEATTYLYYTDTACFKQNSTAPTIHTLEHSLPLAQVKTSLIETLSYNKRGHMNFHRYLQLQGILNTSTTYPNATCSQWQ